MGNNIDAEAAAELFGRILREAVACQVEYSSCIDHSVVEFSNSNAANFYLLFLTYIPFFALLYIGDKLPIKLRRPLGVLAFCFPFIAFLAQFYTVMQFNWGVTAWWTLGNVVAASYFAYNLLQEERHQSE